MYIPLVHNIIIKLINDRLHKDVHILNMLVMDIVMMQPIFLYVNMMEEIVACQILAQTIVWNVNA